MSDDERRFRVVAAKTISASFDVYAEDEDDARFQVENAVGSDYSIEVSDARSVSEDEWDVTDISEIT